MAITPLSQMGPQTTPSDVNAQIQENPNPVQPSPDIDNPQVPMAESVAGASPDTRAQNTMPLQQPAAPPTPPAASAPARPMKRSIFDSVLHTMDPAPDFIIDQKGQKVPVPKTRASMSKHILAGAITSIISGAMAGAAAGAEGEGPAGTRSTSNLKALGAGAQTGQAEFQQMRNRPQQMADVQQLRAYTTMKRNIELKGAMLNLANAEKATQDVAEAPGKAMWTQISAIDQGIAEPSKRILLSNEPMNFEALRQKYPGMTKNNFLMVGHQDMLNQDGSVMTDPETGMPYREPIFVPVNPNAQIPLTDDLKDNLAGTDANVMRIPSGTPVGVSWVLDQYTNHINTVAAVKALEDSAKQIEAVTEEPNATNFMTAIKNDPILRQNTGVISQYFGHGNSPAAAIDAMAKDAKNSAVANRISALLHLGDVDEGGRSVKTRVLAQNQKDIADAKNEELEERKKKMSDIEAQTPKGQADLQLKQLHIKEAQQQLAMAEMQNAGLKPPPAGFVPNPDAAKMTSGDLQRQLVTQGVDVPSNFEALYAVAHNDVSIREAFPASRRKGVNDMSAQNATSFIRAYINPLWSSADYEAAKKFKVDLTPGGKVGQVLQATGVASGHLAMLEKAGEALNNGNIQALNNIANTLQVATGGAPAEVFAAIADKVNQEVTKVASGSGHAMEAQLKIANNLLHRDQSPAQIAGVVQSYVGMMASRVGEIDASHRQYFGRGVPLSPQSTATFAKYGFNFGQDVVTPAPLPTPNLKPPVVRPDYPNGFSKSGTTFWDGQSWVPVPRGTKWDAQNKKWTNQ